jgi:hypothetical protein
MTTLDANKLKEELQEKHPNLFVKNKRFWKLEFVPFIENFIKENEDATIVYEEDDPHRVERCSKCHVFITPEDKYCYNCGTRFKWR